MNIAISILFPYLTLAALIISLFVIRSATLLKVFLALQLVLVFFCGLIEPIGVLALVLFWGLCEAQSRYPTAHPSANFVRILLLLIIALAFANHLIPGFNNPKVINGLQISPRSSTYSMYLNFDKSIAAVLLLLASGLVLKSTTTFNLKTILKTLGLAALAIATLMVLGLSIGYITFDPKFPQIFWLWALNNLLFVCFAEEVIFRGVIQGYLVNIAQKRNWPIFIPIFISALLFGTVLLGHAYGGWAYMGLATLAGIFYGYAYYLTGRLEAAIAVHFSVNLCHFLLFTYPVSATFY
ncbi:MAG TPA: CPBP family intramembrane glutamic endopeptidase [Gammaproteobacteria bacterium]|nr:CPBP family intramembrane glutamic endopeptidase [Gammaproteobacteria bacterium]